jgi:hypothetical protein
LPIPFLPSPLSITMVLKTNTAHNSSSCTSSACRTVTISLIVGCALLIVMTVLVILCCKRGQRKVKNSVKTKVMGLFSGSKAAPAPVNDEEEQLRPQQQPIQVGPVPAPPAPSYYQSSYGQPSYERYEAPYEAPYYPEYQQQQQRQGQWQQKQQREANRDQRQDRSEEREQQQQRRYEAIPEETPAERQQRLTRLASTVASSM